MTLYEIACYLNIPEEVVRILVQQNALPGQPRAKGWDVSLKKLSSWYVALTGQEWANLISNGQVEPLAAEVGLQGVFAGEELHSVLVSWEQERRVKIISFDPKAIGGPKAVLKIRDPNVDLKTMQQTCKVGTSDGPVQKDIELVSRCQKIVQNNPVSVTLPQATAVRFSIEKNMADLPQREREIIRFHLGRFAYQLSSDLNSTHSAAGLP